eukprot:scaffold1607_cov417-Prasinococcus_capsulatus_cf.AAC.9
MPACADAADVSRSGTYASCSTPVAADGGVTCTSYASLAAARARKRAAELARGAKVAQLPRAAPDCARHHCASA